MKKSQNSSIQMRPKGFFAWGAWGFIRFYQIIISPIIHIFPNSGCRFYPTCSQYTIEAIVRHGAFKGIIMGGCRILRCNPFCKGGIDYVPKKFQWKRLFSQNKVDERSSCDN